MTALDDRTDLLGQLLALNENLQALGVPPLVSLPAGEALQPDNLRAAVAATGDYLIDTVRKLRGT